MTRPRLIAFAGLDGAGKTTQADLTAGWLRQSGASAAAVMSRGPSFTRQVLSDLATEFGMSDHMDVFGPAVTRLIGTVLRYQEWTQSVVPALAVNEFVVVDRYVSCAYASARALRTGHEELFRTMLRKLPIPDLTIWLRVTPQTAADRLASRATDSERLSYLIALDQAYQEMAQPAEFVTVDGNAALPVVRDRIQAAITGWLGSRASSGVAPATRYAVAGAGAHLGERR